jgi:hypothetical protein
MKAPRLTEVLLPLLAARAWGRWRIAPRTAADRRAAGWLPEAAGYEAIGRERRERRAARDDGP